MAGMELFDAVFSNDLDRLKRLVKQHKPDLNAPFEEVRLEKHFGMRPIHLAAFYGHPIMLRFLINSGCAVNATTTKFRRTPIHSCVLGQQIPCLRMLIQSGAHVNTQDLFGNSPCHYSAEDGGDSQTLDMLIRNGTNVNANDVTGKTALMKATRNNNTDAVLRLLQAGADPNRIDNNHDIALHFAARNGFNDMIDILLGSGSFNDVQNSWGYTPLIEAVSNSYTKSVHRLVDAGCDLNCQESKMGDTALHIAVKKNDANLVRILLKAGARQVYNHQGETAFFDAVAHNKSDILRLMIDFNCRMDSPVKLIPHVVCKSAFQVAAERGNLETCRVLAELGYVDYSSRDFFYTHYLPARPIAKDASLAWLQDAMQHVLSLRQLCRKAVRQCCDHRLPEKVELIPLPRGLQDYLLAKE
ncbi:hypothetical protein ACOMHN_029191 [Nucella lapillus]